MLRWAPRITLVAMLGPTLAGLAATLLPAFGWMPALGGRGIGLDPWRALLAEPGLGRSLWLSASSGVLATALALGVVVLIFAGWQDTRLFGLVRRGLSPLLSIPHAAAAFGLAFLIAPSGWIARLLSPWATGWQVPPDLLIVGDPLGLSLVAGLVVKEVPFLFLMTLAALGQVPCRQSLAVAQTLGHGRVWGWLVTVFPRLYPQIRLPVYAVLAYSLSVVDVAMILGPTTPPPLAVRVIGWLRDPDLSRWFVASAGAMMQVGLVAGAIALWALAERLVARLGRMMINGGWRGLWADPLLRPLGALGAGGAAGAAVLGLLGLAVWSVAGYWTFPDALPAGWTARTWLREAGGLPAVAGTTALLALAAAGIALVLALCCLEAEQRHGLRPGQRALWLLYLPLIVPQVGFLTGLTMLLTALGLDRSWGALVAGHLVFVLPYVFLSLADPYRAWDGRYGVTAAGLGASPDRVFWRLRLPMLLAPVLTAAAVGFAVSVGQYLPTLLIGGGRFATVTTEAVALSSGGDRRAIGVYGLVQMLLPFAGFVLALAVPAFLFRNRAALRPGGQGGAHG